jgi:hypothetical protein
MLLETRKIEKNLV